MFANLRYSIQHSIIKGRSYSCLFKNTESYKHKSLLTALRNYSTKNFSTNIEIVEKEIRKVEDEIVDLDSQIKSIM